MRMGNKSRLSYVRSTWFKKRDKSVINFRNVFVKTQSKKVKELNSNKDFLTCVNFSLHDSAG